MKGNFFVSRCFYVYHNESRSLNCTVSRKLYTSLQNFENIPNFIKFFQSLCDDKAHTYRLHKCYAQKCYRVATTWFYEYAVINGLIMSTIHYRESCTSIHPTPDTHWPLMLIVYPSYKYNSRTPENFSYWVVRSYIMGI